MKNRAMPSGLTRGRAAVLRALREQPDPVGIEALAQATARHTNTVREQVTWLVQHGLVERVRQPSDGRGRPAWLYQARGPRPGDQDYVELAAALAWRLQDPSDSARSEALVAGRQWGDMLVSDRELPQEPGPEEGRRWTVELLDDLGYEPEADPELDHVVLHRCPLLQAAHRFQEVVCAVHLGVVQSALGHAGADPDRARLTPFSAPGECALRLLAPPT